MLNTVFFISRSLPQRGRGVMDAARSLDARGSTPPDPLACSSTSERPYDKRLTRGLTPPTPKLARARSSPQRPTMPREDHHGINDQLKASLHRRDDAQVLFNGARWRASMYLGGYAVECLLKARLMKKFGCMTLASLDDTLKSRNLIANRSSTYTHEIEWLLKISEVHGRLKRDGTTWPAFNLVNRWMPSWRYDPNQATRDEAETFLEALDRILLWLKANF